MLNVLLIEDSAADADIIAHYLAQALVSTAYEFVHCSTLTAGLVSSPKGPPHVVLLDLTLPDSTGVTTVERAQAALPGALILVLTGATDRALATSRLAAGAQDYMHKDDLDAATLRRAVLYGMGRFRSRTLRPTA